MYQGWVAISGRPEAPPPLVFPHSRGFPPTRFHDGLANYFTGVIKLCWRTSIASAAWSALQLKYLESWKIDRGVKRLTTLISANWRSICPNTLLFWSQSEWSFITLAPHLLWCSPSPGGSEQKGVCFCLGVIWMSFAKAIVIILTISQTRPNPFISLWPRFYFGVKGQRITWWILPASLCEEKAGRL